MALTFKHDLDRITTNQQSEYLGQTSFSSKIIVRAHLDTHTR